MTLQLPPEFSDRIDRFVFGSNTFVNCTTVIHLDGETQMHLEKGIRDDRLLLTTDIYNAAGDHVGLLRRNSWAFHDDERYTVTTAPKALTLVERDTGDYLFVAKVSDARTIVVDHADFYGKEQSRVIASETDLKLERPFEDPETGMIDLRTVGTMSSNQLAGTNGIRFGPNGLQI